MTLEQQTLHLALAAAWHVSPDLQVLKMALRYRKQAASPRIRREMMKVINHKSPAKLVLKAQELQENDRHNIRT